MKVVGRLAPVALLALLALVSCPSPQGPSVYERIVIDTFSPGFGFTPDTFIDLFDANGDPDTDDPWTGIDTGQVIAWDDNGSTEWVNMARIDYTGGMMSGTYYIRVRGNVEAFDEYYAIRVLSLNVGDSLPDYPIFSDPLTYLPLAAKPDAYDTPVIDDNPTQGGIPTNPASIGLGTSNSLSRSFYRDGVNPDIDWFVLVLP